MTEISIIIVNWNTEKLLLDCIASIKRETKKRKLEIIVVDNASSDNSVKSVKNKYKDVIVIENTANVGFAKANNQGIAQSKGKYICLSNTDIIVLDNALERMFTFMENNPDAGAVLPKCLDNSLAIRRCCRRFPSLRYAFNQAFYLNKIFPKISFFNNEDLPESFYACTAQVDTVPCCFILVRRDALNQVGLLDERFFIYAEDIDWSKRFSLSGWKVMYLAEASIIHFGGQSSQKAPAKFLIEKHKSELQYWEKHHGLFKAFLYRLILILGYKARIAGYLVLFIFSINNRKTYKNTLKNYSECLLYLALNTGRGIQPLP